MKNKNKKETKHDSSYELQNLLNADTFVHGG